MHTAKCVFPEAEFHVAPLILITVNCYTQVTNGAEKLESTIKVQSLWHQILCKIDDNWFKFLRKKNLGFWSAVECVTPVEHTFRAQRREFHIFIPCRINLILMWKWYQPFECFITIVKERIISANGPDPYKQSSTALIPVAVMIPEVKRRPLQLRLRRDMYHFHCSPPYDFTHPRWRHD